MHEKVCLSRVDREGIPFFTPLEAKTLMECLCIEILGGIMKKSKSRKGVTLKRITVDEKLSENLVRILVSKLAKGVKEYAVAAGKWGKEEEYLLSPDNYTKELGLSKSMAQQFPWYDLEEGQVFLLGNFKTAGSRTAPRIAVRKGPMRMMRIDEMLRTDIEQLYSNVLRQVGV